MAKQRKKIVKQNKEIITHKKPINIENPKGYFENNPSWSFKLCDFGISKWNLCNCKDFYGTIFDKLISFEGLTWAEIQSANGGRRCGTNNHFIPIYELEKEARDRTSQIHLDVDELFSLRLDGTKRLFGVIDDGVFSIIWYTENHDICLSNKRNT